MAMSRGKDSNKDNTTILIYLAAFLLSAIPALFLSAPFVEDSLGTMGAAAYLTGHDWGDFLVEKGFYYKYGQTLFYLPVFLLLHEPVMRYKALLAVNSVITAFIPVIIYKISTRHLEMDKGDAVAVSFLAGCMPSALMYAKLTWAEPVLFLVPWVLILNWLELADTEAGLYRINVKEEVAGKLHLYRKVPVARVRDCDLPSGDVLENNQLVKRQGLISMLLAWICVYAFMSHQRGIVVVLGTVLFVILWAVRNRRVLVNPVVFGVNLVAAIVLDRVLDAWLKLYVYQGAKLKHNLLASFLDIEIYRKMFSAFGLKALFCSVTGWLFNSAVSGLGISLLGIAVCFAIFFGYKRIGSFFPEKFRIICVFGLILYVGAFLLGLLFFFEGAYGYWDESMVTRCDHLVFGRYLESTLPVMMFVGLYTFTRLCGQERTSDRGVINVLYRLSDLVFVLLILMTVFFGIVIFPVMEGVDSYVHSLMSMNVCFDMSSVTITQDIIPNLGNGIIIFAAISCALFALFMLLTRKGMIKAVYALVGGLFLYIYMRSFFDILYRVDVNALTDYAQYYLTH